MDIALLVVRFIARLRRRVNTVLRPILGKRKLRTLDARNDQRWESELLNFTGNVWMRGRVDVRWENYMHDILRR